MNSSLPGSPVPGSIQARILEWVAISVSRGSSQSRNQTCVSCIACSQTLVVVQSSMSAGISGILLLNFVECSQGCALKKKLSPKVHQICWVWFCSCTSVGLDECVMACVHHHSLIQNNVRALKILWATPFFFFFYPYLPPKPWQPLIFSVSPWFCHFQNVIWLESYSVWPLHMGFSTLEYAWKFPPCLFIACFFSFFLFYLAALGPLVVGRGIFIVSCHSFCWGAWTV